MASYFEPLIMAAIGTASKIVSSQQQMAVLDQTKTLTESALQMLYTAKEAGGNPKVPEGAPVISPFTELRQTISAFDFIHYFYCGSVLLVWLNVPV